MTDDDTPPEIDDETRDVRPKIAVHPQHFLEHELRVVTDDDADPHDAKRVGVYEYDDDSGEWVLESTGHTAREALFDYTATAIGGDDA